MIVRHQGRFLVVREVGRGQPWYLPAGRAEPGESFLTAACRETWEEGGISVRPTGILRIEHSPDPAGEDRMRVIFVGEPDGDPTPKSKPDEHSLEARWVTLDELAQLPLRGPEVAGLFGLVAAGATVHPLDLLARESDPLPAEPPPRPVLMLLAVEDLDRSSAFYDQAFGWPSRVRVPVYVEYQLDGARGLGLYQREAFGRNTGGPPVPVPPGQLAPVELYFRLPHAAHRVDRLVDAGARILSGMAPRPWGETVAYLADPDGNVLALADT